MKQHFDDIYKKNQKTLGDPVWIDAQVINDLNEYLFAHNELSGVRFCFGATSSPQKSMIFLTPTIGNTPPRDEYRQDIKMNNPAFMNYNFTKDEGDRFHESFDNFYRHSNSEDSVPLSTKVWFDKCVINYLSSLIKIEGLYLDGIRVYFAAYFKANEAKGQIDPNQSTVVIVPTEYDSISKEHIDNFEVMDTVANYYSKAILKSGALNHGQLCPNECN